MEKAKKEMNMKKAKKGKAKPDSANNIGKVAFGMMSCAASAAPITSREISFARRNITVLG